jgi:hypothetical protein
MLIIDEANFLKAKTFSEIRRLHDKLGISIVLVGTDRLDAVLKGTNKSTIASEPATASAFSQETSSKPLSKLGKMKLLDCQCLLILLLPNHY